ncbi:HNH endonuclease [Macrococcus hajekii]|uniref:HNH endonuclease n=1 Tax=Macrococcus hajekii TaxID=198482 RepID=A0A4R6BLQ4_9STAP|nr:HNH endonuclease signature motif containing protein [Macrococcus hajekii]TDM02552.1 HNH endonuclease [Macrococcus hajekii]GGB01879.1 hypothetical protein GCM10007190_07350 [Macrococcus hajekii]
MIDEISKDFQLVINNICDLMTEKNPPNQAIKKHRYDIIYEHYKNSEKFKNLVNNLYYSDLKDYFIYLNTYFKKNYFKFCNYSGNIKNFNNLINVNNSNLVYDTYTIYTNFKHDYYFKLLPDIYDLINNKSQTEKLRHFIKEWKNVLEECNNFKYLCPFCQSRDIEYKELDHFLPKTVIPILSIHLDNLVPVCKTCNSKRVKGNRYPSFPIIHPYDSNVKEIGMPIDFVKFDFNGIKDGVEVGCEHFVSNNQNEQPNRQAVNNYIDLFLIKERYEKLYKVLVSDVLEKIKEYIIIYISQTPSSNRLQYNEFLKIVISSRDSLERYYSNSNQEYNKFKKDFISSLDVNTLRKLAIMFYEELISEHLSGESV